MAGWWSMENLGNSAVSWFGFTEFDAKIIAAGMRRNGLTQVRISQVGGLWRVRGRGDTRKVMAKVAKWMRGNGG